MVMQEFKLNGVDIKIDSFLLQRLDNIHKVIKRNFDFVLLVDGVEGSGKSTLGLTCAWYLSKGKFGINNICEGSQDAVDKLEKLPDKSVMLIDEGSLLFSSKDAMRKEQKKLISIIQVIRQKNMILIIVAPSFFDLNKYISVDRSRFLLHVYTGARLERGKFTYFGTRKKRMLYALGRKNYNSYAKPRSDFVGRFDDFEPPFYKEYLKTKRKSLIDALRRDEKPKEIDKETQILSNFQKYAPEVTQKVLAKGFCLSERTIRSRIATIRGRQEELGAII